VSVDLERAAIVVVPLVCVATLALGLRLGAAPAVHAAVVYGAPPGAAKERLAWQLLTVKDDRGVREAVPMTGLSVVASANGKDAHWAGETNSDGIAELALELAGVGPGDLVHLEVRAAGETAALAQGFATWPAVLPDRSAPQERAFVRPSKQDGELAIDVAVYGGRLAPGFADRVWIRVRDRASGTGVRGARVFAEPEPGLAVGGLANDGGEPAGAPHTTPLVTADDAGWAMLTVTAEIHVVALALRAESPGVPAEHGAWYGGLPVAPGGANVPMPLAIPKDSPHAFDVFVSTVLPKVYVEVDDDVGRVTAAVLPLPADAPFPHATLEVGPLPAGTYWFVTAGDSHGAENLEGSAIARPFEVDMDDNALGRGPRLASLATPRFSRFVALDGLSGRRRADATWQRRGLFVAFLSLATAAALEMLLILRGVQRARRELARVAAMVGEEEERLETRFSGASVTLGLFIALLGFALLAVLLTWKAS
jgi:hypothetical protein